MRRVELALIVTLQLCIIAAGLGVLWQRMSERPIWEFLMAAGLVALVGALVIAHNIRELPRRKLPPREPNVILRWLMLAVTLVVAAFVLVMGLFVQFVMSAGAAVISPHLPFWVFLVVGSLWTAGVVTGVIREFYRQLRREGQDRVP
jgi:hypothetical protein